MQKWMENVSKERSRWWTKDDKEKLEIEEHVLVPKRLRTTREDLEVFGFTARCPGCLSLIKATASENVV